MVLVYVSLVVSVASPNVSIFCLMHYMIFHYASLYAFCVISYVL